VSPVKYELGFYIPEDGILLTLFKVNFSILLRCMHSGIAVMIGADVLEVICRWNKMGKDFSLKVFLS
jgi:hypothetical protein